MSAFVTDGYPGAAQPGPPSPYDVTVPNYPAQPWYQGERLRQITRAYQENAAEYALTHRGPEGLIDAVTYDVYSEQLFSRPVWNGPPDNSIIVSR